MRTKPFAGAGVGLRATHLEYVLTHAPAIPWFEALSDNYLNPDSLPTVRLRQVAQHYPICLHSVGMSLGSTDPLNLDYLKRLRHLVDDIQPRLVTDHLCWISKDEYFHELLPLPYTKAVVSHLADRIKAVQDILGRQIAVENVSTYLSYQHSELPEWAFVNQVAQAADCGILLDVNNIYVSAVNNGLDPQQYLAEIDSSRVQQYHLAGFEDKGTHLLDTHGAPVAEAVWQLYRLALEKVGVRPTLIEWDRHIPAFSVLEAEATKAQQLMDQALCMS